MLLLLNLKDSVNIDDLQKLFNEVKNKIMNREVAK
jgi:hypothetical protein